MVGRVECFEKTDEPPPVDVFAGEFLLFEFEHSAGAIRWCFGECKC